ncbi:hypothetical protein ACH4VR_29550 [Streptomyces sp. NPDC020883]|uniref:hypothetical protein n=1 Tax=Streptomyces sp. NPDC020883 TaxID=3365099 RepID=UPI0037A11312
MSQTVETMPDAEEVMRRLTACDDDPYMVEKLYPRIVNQLAGRELTGSGVVMGLTLAISDYGADLGDIHGPIVTKTLMIRLGHLVKHLLGDSKVLSDAQADLRELGITT